MPDTVFFQHANGEEVVVSPNDPLPVTTTPGTSGAGSAAAAARVTLASDDPAVVALQVIDDWDESDRAKVNPIAGQAGVAAGAGAISALTQRVTLASDQPPINVSDATVAVTVTVTLTVGASYATGDFVGTNATPISFANAVRTSGGSATLRGVTISDPAASAAVALELWLFNATITPPNDSAAWNLSDADGLKCVGIVSIPTTAQFLSSATGVMHVGNLGLQFHCAATTLFGALVTRGAPTYTGTLQVMLEIEYDQ